MSVCQDDVPRPSLSLAAVVVAAVVVSSASRHRSALLPRTPPLGIVERWREDGDDSWRESGCSSARKPSPAIPTGVVARPFARLGRPARGAGQRLVAVWSISCHRPVKSSPRKKKSRDGILSQS